MPNIEQFPEGSRVIIVGLEDMYKDVTIVRVNDSGVSIDGSMRIGEEWKALESFVISCKTPVVLDTGERSNMKIIKPDAQGKISEEDKKAGISAKDFAEQNNWTYPKALNYLKDPANAIVVGEVQNQRGRPTKLFKIIKEVSVVG